MKYVSINSINSISIQFNLLGIIYRNVSKIIGLMTTLVLNEKIGLVGGLEDKGVGDGDRLGVIVCILQETRGTAGDVVRSQPACM